MAEVLSPMMPQNQSLPMLHTQSSTSDIYEGAMSGQPQPSRIMQMPRSHFNSQNGVSVTGYRGTAAASVSPYALKASTYLLTDTHTPSTFVESLQPLTAENASAANQQLYPSQSSISATPSASASNISTWGHQLFTKDDSVLTSKLELTPYTMQPWQLTDSVVSENDDVTRVAEIPTKAIPDRYRRNRRSEGNLPMLNSQQPTTFTGLTGPNGFGTAKIGQFFQTPQQINISSQKVLPGPYKSEALVISGPYKTETVTTPVIAEPENVQDKEEHQSPSSLRRYRRRSSLGIMEAGTNMKQAKHATSVQSTLAPAILSNGAPTFNTIRPVMTEQEVRPPTTANLQRGSFPSSGSEAAFVLNRSHTDAIRRMNNSSPLARATGVSEIPRSPISATGQHFPPLQGSNQITSQSPAVAAMAALNEKDPGKGVKSRLRRAFSFASSAELRRVAGENDNAADRAKARQAQFSNELDEEQDAIARKQEASGFGNSIYSGQGNVFTGSTDNLSISSTASSASMMLRKMGRGLKKGGRNVTGIFRSKSVIGVPAADGPIQAKVGDVSRVTVEAEREKVNVNLDPHDQVGGGTGFPRLEKNSADAARVTASAYLDGATGAGASESRSMLIGGEKERADMLAGNKRGILKRASTTTELPVFGFVNSPNVERLRPIFPGNSHRRASPSPSTTSSEPRRSGHRRTDSVTLEGDDYFAAVPRLSTNGTTQSLPGTPRGLSRNISFSPRIQFHDVWSSTEYDRRGDIATCNRLTPMLAQQIKEELNSFKMEMEIHEQSKPHTHFF